MAVGFNNIPSDIRVPLFYAEMDNSQANSGATHLRRLLIGLVNDNVTLTDPELILPSSSSEVAEIAGAGSVLHEMHKVHRQVDPMGETWVLPIKISTGSMSSGKFAISGTASAAGVLTVYIGDAKVAAGVSNGDSAVDIANALINAINSATLPVSASLENTSDVKVAAKFNGELGNDLLLSINLRGSAGGEVLPKGVTVSITPMAGGVGVPDLDTALAALGDEPFEFIVHPFTDSGALDGFKALMGDDTGRWSWMRKIYGHVYSAKRGTLGSLSSFGSGATNDQHMTVSAVEVLAPTSVWKWAADFAARTSVLVSADPARPTQTGSMLSAMPAPEGKRFDLMENNTLLWSGIATTYYEGGSVRIQRSATMYIKNTFGQPDDSYLDSETMHQSAAILRRLESIITSKYARHKLANDGTRFGPGQAIVTPSTIRGELIAEYHRMEIVGLVENSKLFAKYLIVERDEQNPNRINVLFPPDYVNQLRIVALRNEFRLQYPSVLAE